MTNAHLTFIPGPWQHRYVAANGARFHVVEGQSTNAQSDVNAERPLVLLLHDFPQFWYAWREHLPVLADAGYRPVAIDIRGYGASDKPPRGYDVSTLVNDISGIIRSLGHSEAIIVGAGFGGWLAWAMAMFKPEVVRGVAVLAMTHPAVLARPFSGAFTQRGTLDLARIALPGLPERAIRQGHLVRSLLSRWSADPTLSWLEPEVLTVYEAAMRLPAVDRSALGYLRWIVRSRARGDMRTFIATARRRVALPVLHVMGDRDGFINPAVAPLAARFTTGVFTSRVLEGVGHFVAEEAGPQLSEILLEWLATLPRTQA